MSCCFWINMYVLYSFNMNSVSELPTYIFAIRTVHNNTAGSALPDFLADWFHSSDEASIPPPFYCKSNKSITSTKILPLTDCLLLLHKDMICKMFVLPSNFTTDRLKVTARLTRVPCHAAEQKIRKRSFLLFKASKSEGCTITRGNQS